VNPYVPMVDKKFIIAGSMAFGVWKRVHRVRLNAKLVYVKFQSHTTFLFSIVAFLTSAIYGFVLRIQHPYNRIIYFVYESHKFTYYTLANIFKPATIGVLNGLISRRSKWEAFLWNSHETVGKLWC